MRRTGAAATSLGRADVSGVRTEQPPGLEEAAAEPYAIDAGVVVLRVPVAGRRRARAAGDGRCKRWACGQATVVFAELEAGRLVIFSVAESVRRMQAMVRDLIPGDHSLADGLIAERRAEAAREDD